MTDYNVNLNGSIQIEYQYLYIIKLFHLILALFVHKYGDVFIQNPIPGSRCNDSLSLTQYNLVMSSNTNSI